jgi:hypothetical protein
MCISQAVKINRVQSAAVEIERVKVGAVKIDQVKTAQGAIRIVSAARASCSPIETDVGNVTRQLSAAVEV